MSRLAASEAGTRIALGVMVLHQAEVACLFGLFFDAVLRDVAPFETPEAFDYCPFPLIIVRQLLLEISGCPFPLWLQVSLFLVFVLLVFGRVFAWEVAFHNFL